MLQLTFFPGLRLTVFRTTRSRRISGAKGETLYTSTERDHLRDARIEKNPPVVTPLFMLNRPLEMTGMKEWERTKQFNLLARKMCQITNLQMYTWRKTFNRPEHLNLAKFKPSGAEWTKI